MDRSNPNALVAKDSAVLHPYTHLGRQQETGPWIAKRGDGVFVSDVDGNRYLEAMSGLWSAALGFSEPRLAAAAARQMEDLTYYPIFNGRGTGPAIELAHKLVSMAPAGLDKVLFATSGSEANDQAIKIVWYYHNAIGKPRKKKIIARDRAYHGVTIYTAGLTGLAANHNDFDLPLGGILHTHAPSYYLNGQVDESEAEFVERICGDLEQLVIRENPETIGAFIAEPVQGAGGVIVPPAGYFARVQEILRRYDILLIADEVISGFGRTGSMFGCETFGIQPDMMTLAKALSASALPISATLVSARIHDAMVRQSEKLGSFGHGFTYAGHPVCAAVALEAINIYQERDIVGHVRRVGPYFQKRLRRLGDHGLVGEARGVGLVGALHLTQAKGRMNVPFPAAARLAGIMGEEMKASGIMTRATNEGIYFCPPLIITQAEIDLLFDGTAAALDRIERRLAAGGHL